MMTPEEEAKIRASARRSAEMDCELRLSRLFEVLDEQVRSGRVRWKSPRQALSVIRGRVMGVVRKD